MHNPARFKKSRPNRNFFCLSLDTSSSRTLRSDLLESTGYGTNVVTTVSPQSRRTEGGAISRDGRYVVFDVLKAGTPTSGSPTATEATRVSLRPAMQTKAPRFQRMADSSITSIGRKARCIYTASHSREGRPSRFLTADERPKRLA